MKIGIIGCGQLARMLALAGWPRGVQFSFLAGPQEDPSPVMGLGTIHRLQEGDSAESIYQGLGEPDVITTEREQVEVALLASLQPFAPVFPQPEAVSICQHRAREKQFINDQGIATAPWQPVTPQTDLLALGHELGWPLFIKSCEDGYDGYNQWRINGPDDALPTLPEGVACIAEGGVAFERELSLVAVRGRDGKVRCYPLTENHHTAGILQHSLAPAPALADGLQQKAEAMAQRLLSAMNYVGVLTLELFLVNGEFKINELAPRVHNSGHWTQSGALTCQFENHVRAIAGLPLGPTDAPLPAAMVNLLGVEPPNPVICPDAKLHWYNKSVRPGRKVGHLNLTHADPQQLSRQVSELVAILYP
ncbi:phosphoribosylaminoimidazole carboxylase, ATPase subunit [Ferrimonas balearica DSM 9799]|uniref:N5-carboxyaminoimidazole ribonucleotide synthase n=1 Tax=Ferrimonas balearica (strain DSM 9799 / CCM 4581 / KCTC 23876 / PAT) TaxID=550540 RepID=E1SUW1_FERBD|nr:5-(carboxyamino)imidazole ribonucleotide synthase [Ferrimonas balearica]ADN76288.1 phosphoribosylaminoimidazole carboxylase, ATPase subunit [Ferrimonas balearica DSM 9799]